MKHVQFEDESEEKVVAVFGCAQDPDARQFMAEVEDNDARFLAYVESLPEQFREATLSM